MTGKPNLAKTLRIRVLKHDIEESKCGDPNKCMIKLAVARVINIPHGYIKVDSTGISLTRRNDYREKAFIPKPALLNLLKFDKDKSSVKPFSFMATFHKTSRVYKSSEERRAKVNAARKRRHAEGRPDKQYGLSKRLEGLSLSKGWLQAHA